METNSPNGRQSDSTQNRAPVEDLPESLESGGGRGAQRPPPAMHRGSARASARRGPLERSRFNSSPFESMMRLSREMDRLVGSLFGGGQEVRGGGMSMVWSPQIDVRHSGDTVIVSAEVPGVSRDAIQIEATEDGIAISGERRESHEAGEPGRYQLTERSFGSFYRNIPLPEGAQVEKARASMRDGVLEITVPLRPSRGRKRIDISS
jgi:HSP20 family protein